jgi:glc operon protein GlcG
MIKSTQASSINSQIPQIVGGGELEAQFSTLASASNATTQLASKPSAQPSQPLSAAYKKVTSAPHIRIQFATLEGLPTRQRNEMSDIAHYLIKTGSPANVESVMTTLVLPDNEAGGRKWCAALFATGANQNLLPKGASAAFKRGIDIQRGLEKQAKTGENILNFMGIVDGVAALFGARKGRAGSRTYPTQKPNAVLRKPVYSANSNGTMQPVLQKRGKAITAPSYIPRATRPVNIYNLPEDKQIGPLRNRQTISMGGNRAEPNPLDETPHLGSASVKHQKDATNQLSIIRTEADFLRALKTSDTNLDSNPGIANGYIDDLYRRIKDLSKARNISEADARTILSQTDPLIASIYLKLDLTATIKLRDMCHGRSPTVTKQIIAFVKKNPKHLNIADKVVWLANKSKVSTAAAFKRWQNADPELAANNLRLGADNKAKLIKICETTYITVRESIIEHLNLVKNNPEAIKLTLDDALKIKYEHPLGIYVPHSVVQIKPLARVPVIAPITGKPLQYGQSITAKRAKKVIEGAEAEALRQGWPVSITVVDVEGKIVLQKTLKGTQHGSIQLAHDKASTAALFRRDTKIFQDLVNAGQNQWKHVQNITPLQGGVPIFYKGKIIGAIGVSGVTSAQDEIIAKMGADMLRTAK